MQPLNMVFLDADILIELVVPGRAKYIQVSNLLKNYQEAAMSTLTAHLCWHFGRQAGVSDDLIATVIDSITLLSIEPDDYYWARRNERGKDFEDVIQLACSIRSNCVPFITLDKNLTKRYAGYTEFVTI